MKGLQDPHLAKGDRLPLLNQLSVVVAGVFEAALRCAPRAAYARVRVRVRRVAECIFVLSSSSSSSSPYSKSIPEHRRCWSPHCCCPTRFIFFSRGRRHRMSRRSVYRAGLRGEVWTTSREARLVLVRQLEAYNEAIDDGINLEVYPR